MASFLELIGLRSATIWGNHPSISPILTAQFQLGLINEWNCYERVNEEGRAAIHLLNQSEWIDPGAQHSN